MDRPSIIIHCAILLYFVGGCSAPDGPLDYLDPEEIESVPSYFNEHLKDKEEQINDAIQTSTGDYSTLIFFTDAHWGYNQKHSPALINHLYHSTPIDDVVFGGDVITTSFKNPQDAITLGKNFRRAFDAIGCNMYYLYGNHDNNSDEHPNEVERHLSDEQVYEYLQKGMAECTYGGYFNFFFDRPESKTRFLCLDTGRFYYSQFRGNTIETVKFLIDALNGTPEGWRVVLLSHLWAFLQAGEPCLIPYMITFLSVLDNFNARKKGVFRYEKESVNYDFSDASSKIICCIGGHCHLDATLFSDGGIPVIITAADKSLTGGNSSVIGTIDEQAISVFVFDYCNAAIKMYRVGRGHDIEVQIK